MSGYGIALFVHLVALLVAASATTLTHLAAVRAARAESAREALDWHRFAGRAAIAFPFVVLTLVATGSYMVGVEHQWPWSAGWVRAGLLGSLLLLVQGGILGARARRIGAALAAVASGASTTRPAPDPVMPRLSWANTGIALAVVFDMAAKPGLTGALAILALGGLLGAFLGRPPRAAAVAMPVPERA